MNKILRQKLINIAREKISSIDVSHDFNHAFQVLLNAEKISKIEKGDLDIIIPSSLFHDIIVYPKNQANRLNSQEDSANKAETILNTIKEFPKEKIEKVKTCIIECSFSKGMNPTLKESMILQDADLLESTGAISIMRACSSSGQMGRPLYNLEDPFCKNQKPQKVSFGLDLFYVRLLKAKDKVHTKTAKIIAKRRTNFLRNFLKELSLELKGK